MPFGNRRASSDNGDLHREKARYEGHEVHVVAADIRERISVLRGEPALEARASVPVGLQEPRLAHDQLAELAGPIGGSGHEGPPVEALVVLHADKKAASVRL